MDVLSRNNVTITGQGTRPLVFSHGYGCDQNMWRYVATAFEDQYKVVRFDHVGAGKSDWSAYDRSKYASLDGYAADTLEILAALDLHDVVFIGHSVSAMVGMVAALREPARFSALVMIGPSACYINDDHYAGGFERADIDGLIDSLEANYLGWSRTMAPVIMGNPERPELAGELANSFCQADPEIARQFARVTFLSDHRANVPRVHLPTQILQCSDDMIAPLSVGQYLWEHLPRGELTILEATGHCPHLSAPQETIEAMKLFLAKHAP